MRKLVCSMTEEERTADFCFGKEAGKEAHWGRDRNLHDVFIHLHEWHMLLLNWVESNMKGEARPFLREPYNWKTYGQMNIEFWEEHRSTSYGESERLLLESHTEVMRMIAGLSEDDLFKKGRFPWTGGSPLGAYCVSATSSHYAWAVKKIRMHDRTYKEKN